MVLHKRDSKHSESLLWYENIFLQNINVTISGYFNCKSKGEKEWEKRTALLLFRKSLDDSNSNQTNMELCLTFATEKIIHGKRNVE